MPRTLRLTLLVFTLTLTACKPTPAPPKPIPEPTPKPAMMSPNTRAEKAQLASTHPAYKLFLQKIDMPTVLVVTETTTDDQLKSLLWHLRTKIRANAFKDLGIKPTTTLYGIPGYTSGIVDIYRGSKCASEKYTPEGRPDPCGSSIHASANYHWGDGNDPHADGAYLVSTNGTVTPIFDSTDNWQTESEAQSDPDGIQSRAATARIHYATTETAKQSKRGSDLKFFVAQPTGELNALSYQFADQDGQKRFLNEYVFLEQEHLCAAGFHTIKLATAPKPGTSYPIHCSN